MKLWTINTHSLSEDNYEQKLMAFVNGAAIEKPDIIAMQEVNQRHISKNVTVNGDNHVLRAVKLLKEKGVKYNWKWLPMKIGYDKYDEGLAIMSLEPITETDEFLISGVLDYSNWKTRKILGIKTKDGWFYTVHMGWWNDKEEPFAKHWHRLNGHIRNKENVWLMGDFNSRSDVRGEGYDTVLRSGFYDTYMLASEKDSGITVEKQIDGWRDTESAKMRLDYIFCSRSVKIKSSKVIFNGKNYPVISDHFGVEICL